MSKRLYVAYGSNLNIRQMKHRCPTAKLYGTGEIKDYELQFKGHPDSAFATIAPKEGASVPVAVWEIQARDEMSLDRYEGYPSHYFKQNVPVQLDGEEVNAMVYIMNLKMGFGLPSPYYYQTVHRAIMIADLIQMCLIQLLKKAQNGSILPTVSRTLSKLCLIQKMKMTFYPNRQTMTNTNPMRMSQTWMKTIPFIFQGECSCES